MKQNRYRITVEPISDTNGDPSTHADALQFEAGSHDDLLAIVERMQGRSDFAPDTAAALAVGMKLFGGVMMENRANPLFSEMQAHFGQFMKRLKTGSGAALRK